MSMHTETMTLMEQAKAHLANNDPESAMRLLKKANDLSRGNQELQGNVYFEMAKTSALADRDSVAATFAIQALESNPQLYSKANDWAVTLLKKDKKKLAETIIGFVKDRQPPLPNSAIENISAQDVVSERTQVAINKPGKVTAIGGMRIGSGVCNIIAGLMFFWLLFPILLIPFGIVEIVSASNLLKERPNRPSSFKAIPILEIIAILTLAGWISMVVGIISLAFLANDKVKQYFASL